MLYILPAEIVLQIASKLDVKSALTLMTLTRKGVEMLMNQSSDSALWEERYKRRFIDPLPQRVPSYFEAFKIRHQRFSSLRPYSNRPIKATPKHFKLNTDTHYLLLKMKQTPALFNHTFDTLNDAELSALLKKLSANLPFFFEPKKTFTFLSRENRLPPFLKLLDTPNFRRFCKAINFNLKTLFDKPFNLPLALQELPEAHQQIMAETLKNNLNRFITSFDDLGFALNCINSANESILSKESIINAFNIRHLPIISFQNFANTLSFLKAKQVHYFVRSKKSSRLPDILKDKKVLIALLTTLEERPHCKAHLAILYEWVGRNFLSKHPLLLFLNNMLSTQHKKNISLIAGKTIYHAYAILAFINKLPNRWLAYYDKKPFIGKLPYYLYAGLIFRLFNALLMMMRRFQVDPLLYNLTALSLNLTPANNASPELSGVTYYTSMSYARAFAIATLKAEVATLGQQLKTIITLSNQQSSLDNARLLETSLQFSAHFLQNTLPNLNVHRPFLPNTVIPDNSEITQLLFFAVHCSFTDAYALFKQIKAFLDLHNTSKMHFIISPMDSSQNSFSFRIDEKNKIKVSEPDKLSRLYPLLEREITLSKLLEMIYPLKFTSLYAPRLNTWQLEILGHVNKSIDAPLKQLILTAITPEWVSATLPQIAAGCHDLTWFQKILSLRALKESEQEISDLLLFSAVAGHKYDTLEYLISKGHFALNSFRVNGYSLTAWAVMHENVKALTLLLDKGYDTHIEVKGVNVLFSFIERQVTLNKPLLRQLIPLYLQIPLKEKTFFQPYINRLEQEIIEYIDNKNLEQQCLTRRSSRRKSPISSFKNRLIAFKNDTDAIRENSKDSIATREALDLLFPPSQSALPSQCTSYFFKPQKLTLRKVPDSTNSLSTFAFHYSDCCLSLLCLLLTICIKKTCQKSNQKQRESDIEKPIFILS